MTTTAIYIKEGLVQGVYRVLNAPHSNLIIIDDDNLQCSDNKIAEARAQLEGEGISGHIEFDELHSTLSKVVTSKELSEPVDKVFEYYLSVFYRSDYNVSAESAGLTLDDTLLQKLRELRQAVKNNPVLNSASFFYNTAAMVLYLEDANEIEDKDEIEIEDQFKIGTVEFTLYDNDQLVIRVYEENSDTNFELDATKLLKLI